MASGARTPSGQESQGDAFLQALLRDTTLAVAVTDSTGAVSLMSPALEAMLGIPFSPVAPEEIAKHFHVYTEDRSRMLRPEEIPVNRARAGESFRDAMISVRRDDGVTVYLRCSGTPIRRHDDSVSGGLVLVADITSERAVLLEQQALRDRLVETVNHELRTPLTKLLGHAELLDDLSPDLPATARRSLDAVIEAGNELKELVQTISQLVDLDVAGKAEREPADVVDLVRSTIDAGLEQAVSRGLVLDPQLPDSAPTSVDPGRFCKALSALLDNALTYAPAGSVVTVALRSDHSRVVIDVCDLGPGIPDRDRDRLLQPFERGDYDGQPVNSRGLGLALAHTVAIAHGGTLTLHDHQPRGLRVSIAVPHIPVTLGG